MFSSSATPRPRDAAQAELWKRLAAGELRTPDTWEVALSSRRRQACSPGAALVEGRLGALALLRNLRNMKAAGVSEDYIAAALDTMRTDRVLPFRFPAAARHAPQWEPMPRTRNVSLASSKDGFDAARRTHRPAGRRLRSMVAPLAARATVRRNRRRLRPRRSCSARSRRRSASTPSPTPRSSPSRPGADSLCAMQ